MSRRGVPVIGLPAMPATAAYTPGRRARSVPGRMPGRLPLATFVSVRAAAAGSSVLDRLRRAPSWLFDAVLASAFVVAGLTTTSANSGLYEPRDGVAVGLILAGTLPYCCRRLAPLPVFLCSVSAVAALFALGYDGGSLPTVIAVGAYTVGAYRPLHEVLLAAALLNAALVAMTLAEPPGFGGADLLMTVIGLGAAMLLGWTVQSRRLRLEALEREQGEAARRAAADERLRIAQELHDVVAHSLGVIAVQAGVGMHVIDSDPVEARRALEHISRTSRASLAEIRNLLGLVRSGENALALEPTPGVADLRRLAVEVGEAGLPVDLEIAGVDDVPPGVELAAYRIVQEALTNSLRHASARHATVRVSSESGSVRIVVSDDGSGLAGDHGSSGHGLVGMRERVAVYGGSLDARRIAGGGFRVDATIPYGVVPAT